MFTIVIVYILASSELEVTISSPSLVFLHFQIHVAKCIAGVVYCVFTRTTLFNIMHIFGVVIQKHVYYTKFRLLHE